MTSGRACLMVAGQHLHLHEDTAEHNEQTEGSCDDTPHLDLVLQLLVGQGAQVKGWWRRRSQVLRLVGSMGGGTGWVGLGGGGTGCVGSEAMRRLLSAFVGCFQSTPARQPRPERASLNLARCRPSTRQTQV